MVLTVVVITGGFVIDVGPLHFSAHRLLPPLVIAACVLRVGDRARARQPVVAADAALPGSSTDTPSAIVVVFAAAAAGVGIAFGTYVAAAADPSGYLSQARLIAQGELVVSVPLASRVDWPTPELELSRRSDTVLDFTPGRSCPTYPPGLPLAMALASVVGGENVALPWSCRCSLRVTVLGTYGLAACLHSRTAGVIAASLMASSPLLLSQVVQVMSDIPATALWTLALLAALAGRPISGRGSCRASPVLVRPSLLPVAGCSRHRSGDLVRTDAPASRRVTVALVAVCRRRVRSRRCGPRVAIAVVAVRRSACIGSRHVLRDVLRRQRAAQHSRLHTRVLTGETPALLLIEVHARRCCARAAARQGRRSHGQR